MKPAQIRKDIYWVGAIDWSLRNFHGYTTVSYTHLDVYKRQILYFSANRKKPRLLITVTTAVSHERLPLFFISRENIAIILSPSIKLPFSSTARHLLSLIHI